jgi:hypothetical protein
MAINTKSMEWEYEDEWRIRVSLEGLDKSQDNHGKLSYFAPLEMNAISAIIYGKKSSSDFRRKIRDIVHEKRLQKIIFFEVNMHATEYKLDILSL